MSTNIIYIVLFLYSCLLRLPVLWNLIDLLTLVAGLSSDGSTFQEKFQVLSVMARLLHQCMENKSENAGKLLNIIQILVQVIIQILYVGVYGVQWVSG